MVYFMAIWYILWSFVIFFPFWYVVPRNIWQPCRSVMSAVSESKCQGSNQGPMLWFFVYFRRNFFAKKLAFLTQNKAKFWKKLIITLVFKKNANFFRRKLAKIAENCDHNIDPRCLWKKSPNFDQDFACCGFLPKAIIDPNIDRGNTTTFEFTATPPEL
jgi:hypothetical protein